MSRRHVQHSWDAVRSEIKAQMARCEAPVDAEALAPEDRRIFRLDDADPYYGPTRGAREAINAMLDLGPDAGQIDWEQALANESAIDRLMSALGDHSLDTEVRSAIALLVLEWVDASDRPSTELIARIRWQMRGDPRVQARMRYWWTHMDAGARVMEALS